VLAALPGLSPIELKGLDSSQAGARWSAWVTRHDLDIRSRIDGGDQDTIVNWLIAGTSFTKHPRALKDSAPESTGPAFRELIAARIRDFVSALASPADDERRLFARDVIERRGFRLDGDAERARVEQYLVVELNRSGREWVGYARELQAAEQLDDPQRALAATSRVFRTRGLSTDTSLLPNFALEESLREMKTLGLLRQRSIRRAAVVGPGLDFSDKSLGYDFYPLQTIQPFALVDTLRRLDLADPSEGVRVAAIDISPRVNDHLRRARERAQRGDPYMLNLPLDLGLPWTPEFKEYWKRAGDQIGVVDTIPVSRSVGQDLRRRVVRVRPDVVSRLVSSGLNIVVQRLSGEPFDLIVATNVFVYYDVLDQGLALANIEAMLRPGGYLLTNNFLQELPTLHMRTAGSQSIQYSPDDGDTVLWYRRTPG
jgi:hypothetical protein